MEVQRGAGWGVGGGRQMGKERGKGVGVGSEATAGS